MTTHSICRKMVEAMTRYHGNFLCNRLFLFDNRLKGTWDGEYFVRNIRGRCNGFEQSQDFGNLPATQVAMLSMSFVFPDDGLALPPLSKNLTCIPTISCKYSVLRRQVTLAQYTV
jgi:hypothetical protein